LLDLSILGLAALETLGTMKARQSRTRVVFLAGSFDKTDLTTAANLSAHGVLPKDVPPSYLLRCLWQVASGERFSPPTAWERQRWDDAPFDPPSSLASELTDRERQIVRLVCEGLSNKQIGCELNISSGTTKVHLHHIFQKLAIHNRAALAALAATYQGELPATTLR
jgi:DNA-binding NarL/FixJ family response regulator